MDIKYNTDTKIEDNARLFQLQKANFDQEVNTAVFYFEIEITYFIKLNENYLPSSYDNY